MANAKRNLQSIIGVEINTPTFVNELDGDEGVFGPDVYSLQEQVDELKTSLGHIERFIEDLSVPSVKSSPVVAQDVPDSDLVLREPKKPTPRKTKSKTDKKVDND